jgi:RNA polymerase sigma-70 factor (ECF subfamily)
MMWSRFVNEETKTEYEQDELMNELYKQMFIVAYSKVKNKADALDIVQESWVKILKKIDTLKDRDKLFQWAKVIVANTAINLLKKKSSSHEVSVCSEQLEQRYTVNDMEIEDRIALSEIYESMKKLDVETRKIFIYKFSYGWKDQQIADELKLPVGTVKARLHRGKERLRSILKKLYT